MRIQSPQLRDLFKTPQRKTYTLLGITFIVVGIFVFFSLRPTFVKVSELRREIKDKEEFLSKLEDKLGTVNYLITQKQSIAGELPAFGEDFPTTIKGGFIVANLSGIAQKFDTDLMSVEFSDQTAEEEVSLMIDNAGNIGQAKINITVEGELVSIERFVQYLESFPMIFDIRSFSYSKVDLNEYRNNLSDYRPISCSITFITYFWNQGQS